MGEQFLRENQDKLTPEQQEEMQKKIDDLRAYFDQVERRSNKIDKETQGTIERLEREIEEEVSFVCLCFVCGGRGHFFVFLVFFEELRLL